MVLFPDVCELLDVVDHRLLSLITTSKMRSPTLSSSFFVALLQVLGRASAQSGSSAGGISFPDPTAVSTTYSSKTYDISAATTTLANDDFSDERLAFLWNQVGPVATGPVIETVEPTPEPSAYGNPSGGFHPYIPTYDTNLSAASLPEGFSWGVASSAFQIEVNRLIRSHRAPLTTTIGRRRRRRQRPLNLGLPQPPCRQPSR
jgi:beta-glucosidase